MNSRMHWTRLAFVPALLLGTRTAFAQPPQPPAPVVVAPVVSEELRSGQSFVGTVMPVKTAAIGSAVDGRVANYPRNEGDRVGDGREDGDDVIAELLMETISLELETAEAELEVRRQELKELEAGTRAEEVEQARAKMEASKAVAEFAKSQYDRAQALFRQGRAISESDLEQALSSFSSTQETHREAKAAYEMAVAGPRPETIAQAKARVAMQAAVVGKLRDQKGKHTIRTKFPGYVVAEHTEVGAWVNRGDLIAEVAALDEVDVLVNVVENHVPYVTKGQEIRVDIPALPDKVFTGEVALVVPQADARSRTFPVKVRVKNVITDDGPLIKAGMLARASLPTGSREKALLVPKDALVLGGPKPVVWVVDAESDQRTGKARPVPVDLGVASDNWIQVRGDIREGELAITQGNERVRPGAPVAIARVVKRDAKEARAESTSQR